MSRFLAAFCLVLVCPVLLVPAARADSVSAPFSTSEVVGKCQTPGRLITQKTVQRAPQLSDSPGWQYVKETRSATGHLVTRTFVRNSFRDLLISVYCQPGGVRVRSTNPVTYLHKLKYVNLNCYGMSCRHLYTKITDWELGHCLSNGRGELSCAFKD